MVARTSLNDFISCMRSKNFQPAPASDPMNYLFAQPPRVGYICENKFIDERNLQQAAIDAKHTYETRRDISYPRRYEGAPFHSPCLVWPIKHGGESYGVGKIP